MKNNIITKDSFKNLINQINLSNEINLDFTYDVYELAHNAIMEIYKSNLIPNFQNINMLDLAFYVIGEYYYSVKSRSKTEKENFDSKEEIKTSMASVVADKFLSLSHFSFNERKLTNRYLPTMSSLNLYLNFIQNALKNYKRNDPKCTLITDLLAKSISLSKCILNLLMDGNETEAFATWRTLHECECTLILLDKYKDDIILAYLRHMKYGLAYKGGLSTKEETDAIFEEIKNNMKSHELKSKDMKKYIEYGWLYDVPNVNEIENFKLNFRDGLQKIAGLSSYNSRYEISSEIIHSTPMLFYAVKENYYFMSLLSLYESFFRLENIFTNIYLKNVSKIEVDTYNNFKKVYYLQLLNIHKREASDYTLWKSKFRKK